MNKEKLSLKSIKNVLSRAEMKKIMAGSGSCSTYGEKCGNGIVCCQGLLCSGFDDFLFGTCGF